MDALIEATLDRLGFKPSEASITTLSGGFTNHTYHVVLPHDTYVVRIGGANTALLGVDRAREHAAAVIAAQLGVGAEVILADVAQDILVTRFIAGRTLTVETAHTPDVLLKLARALRRVHDGPAFSGTFSPAGAAQDMLDLARARGVTLPDGLGGAMGALTAIGQALGRSQDLRPCHNDLLAANFIDDGERIWLIDWEYAAMGDPYFDLGNLAVNLELNHAQHPALLAAYGVEAGAKNLARLALMRLASDLREAAWGYLQAGVSTKDVDFMAHGHQHLERFTTGTNSPVFAAWLAAAGE